MACITRDAILFFFRQDVDPNDDTLMVLMEGMAVEKNGKVYTVKSVSWTVLVNFLQNKYIMAVVSQLSFMNSETAWDKIYFQQNI